MSALLVIRELMIFLLKLNVGVQKIICVITTDWHQIIASRQRSTSTTLVRRKLSVPPVRYQAYYAE